MPKRPPAGFYARRAAAGGSGQARLDSAGGQPPGGAAQAGAAPRSHPVGDVISRITALLRSDDQLQDLWVEGEVRNYSQSGAGHIYFRLADDEGALACVLFRGRNRGARFGQGDEVLAHGQVGIYRERGDLQLLVDDVRPRGTGVLQAEFERMRAKLEAEGLFAPERKRALPRYPRRIGVATSSAGAVWHDIQQVLGRRWPLATLVLSPCLTQGDGAAESIAGALGAFAELDAAEQPDVIIVARGGGSPEDLWAYNEEPVARAIFGSPIPVVSAVGHETDFTIADYVADLRAPTPSAAAEIVAPDRGEEAAQVRGMVAAGGQLVERRAAWLQQRLTESQGRLAAAAPDPGALRVDLHRQLQGIERRAAAALGSRNTALAASRGRLEALNPLATLERGYAMLTDKDGVVVGSVAGAAPGNRLRVRLRDGSLGVLIESAELGGAADE